MRIKVESFHLLGGLGEPLLVEGVHQNYLIVYQGRPDGRAGEKYLIWGVDEDKEEI